QERGLPAKAFSHSTWMLPDTPPSRAGSLPQLNRVHLQGIGWLSGRLRGQASLLQVNREHVRFHNESADTKKPGAITDTGFFKQEANRYSAST
ncbi:hypothetical protein, partial [Pseudomonas sp. GM50]|uniref:hypothetical protein n=1 Tax=Pseudomonas sp. GM50 TaxID=1144332 RepID=UPI001EE64D01